MFHSPRPPELSVKLLKQGCGWGWRNWKFHTRKNKNGGLLQLKFFMLFVEKRKQRRHMFQKEEELTRGIHLCQRLLVDGGVNLEEREEYMLGILIWLPWYCSSHFNDINLRTEFECSGGVNLKGCYHQHKLCINLEDKVEFKGRGNDTMGHFGTEEVLEEKGCGKERSSIGPGRVAFQDKSSRRIRNKEDAELEVLHMGCRSC